MPRCRHRHVGTQLEHVRLSGTKTYANPPFGIILWPLSWRCEQHRPKHNTVVASTQSPDVGKHVTWVVPWGRQHTQPMFPKQARRGHIRETTVIGSNGLGPNTESHFMLALGDMRFNQGSRHAASTVGELVRKLRIGKLKCSATIKLCVTGRV